MSNPLDPVWRWYRVARDALRIAKRALGRDLKSAFPPRHVFHTETPEAARTLIEVSQNELDNLAVVAFVAIFERALREYLIGVVQSTLPHADEFESAIGEKVVDSIDRTWTILSLIDEICKHRSAGELRGMVKQIIDHRNDVAHGHVTGQPPPGSAKPEIVYKRLSDFLQAVGVVTP